MRQVRRIFFIGLLGVLLAALALSVTEPSEPSYNGHTLTYWLGHASDDAGGRNAAYKAVKEIGLKSLPILLSYAADRDTRLKLYLVALKFKYRRFPVHLRYAGESQDLAMLGFSILGTNAAPAVPKLIRLLKNDDPEIRFTACRCLSYIGPAAKEAVPALIKEFQREEFIETNDDYIAALALAKIGPEATAAIPILKAGLTNNSRHCRICAQAALLNLSIPATDEFYEQLTNVAISTSYCRLLASFSGTNAAPAVPVLISALKSIDIRIQAHALECLGELDLQPELSVPAIMPFLQSTNFVLRYNAIVSLKEFRQTAKQAGPALAACLTDTNDQVRMQARLALPVIDPDTAKKLGLPLHFFE